MRWAVGLSALLLSGTMLAVGPSNEATMAFVADSYLQQGGGVSMQRQRDGSYHYQRVFPLELSLQSNHTLVIASAHQTHTRTQRVGAEEMRQQLMQLYYDQAADTVEQFEAPLQQLDPGRVTNRRGDWGAARAIVTATGKIRLLCKDYLNCVRNSKGATQNYVDIYMEDDSAREHLAKALQHLITQNQRVGRLF